MNSYIQPSTTCYTVYTKSNCIYCFKVKQLFKDYDVKFIEVNCDEYLMENRAGFLEFIKSNSNRDYKTFPMVFNCGVFIGGYNETIRHLEKEFIEFNDFF